MSTAVQMAGEPLTPDEGSRLEEREAIIERGMRSFVEVGQALAEIRDGRLYRETHGTFESYCEGRWGFSRPRAYQFIEAAGVISSLSTFVDTPRPTSEGQARALSGLTPETMAEVMERAFKATAGDLTATAITEAREEIAPKAPPPPPRPPSPQEAARQAERDAQALAEERVAWTARIFGTLSDFRNPEYRQRVRDAWRIGALGAPPTTRPLHNPDTLRELGQLLITYADECEHDHA